jgi:ribosome maturation factor RimP
MTMAAVQNNELLERITGLGERSAMGSDIEIVEIQLKGAGNARLLRVYIDKPGGVTHGDCELISERLGKLLDEEDPLPESHYTLEVSSPGIERRLTKPRDFERVVGQKIRVAVQPPGEARRSLVEGRLAQFSGGTLEVEVPPGNTVRIPLDTVQKANLKFEW